MGDPGVFQANPHPHPLKTHTHAQGMGFSGLGSWVCGVKRVQKTQWVETTGRQEFTIPDKQERAGRKQMDIAVGNNSTHAGCFICHHQGWFIKQGGPEGAFQVSQWVADPCK